MFNAIKLLGAVYLIYLGVKMLRSTSAGELDDTRGAPMSDLAALRIGFLSNAMNPKTTVFIVSLFMQVVRPGTPMTVQMSYGLFISLAHIAWLALLALCFSAGTMRDRLLGVRRWIDRAFGGLLIVFGVLLGVASGSQ